MRELTNGEQTAAEVEATATFAQREGKIDKDTLDWFRHGYKKQQAERGQRERQAQSYSPRLSV